MKTFAVRELMSAAGQDLGSSEYRTITQERVNLFADATDDHQWIHVDPARAAAGPFGATIVHAYLTLSLVPSMLLECVTVNDARMSLNYGLNKLRFPAPLAVGKRVGLSAHISSTAEIEGGCQIVVAFVVAAEGAAKPCAVGEAVYNFYT